jgi:hypothetical protein
MDSRGTGTNERMRLIMLCGVLALAGCPDRSISPVDPVQAGALTKDIPVDANLDILFVIDDSGSTGDKQALFAQNYKNFVSVLEGFPGGLPSLHLGVVTSSIDVGRDVGQASCHPSTGENGTLQNTSRDAGNPCSPPTADRYLIDAPGPDGHRTQNYTGSLTDALSCISHTGENGCGLEAPLEAMKRALDGSRPENAGFLRRGALLAVVLLTDEDDCSADPRLFDSQPPGANSRDFVCAQSAYLCDQPISSMPGMYTGCRVRHDGLLHDPRDYADFLGALKGPSGVVVALIAGNPATSISTGAKGAQALAVIESCSTMINNRTAIARPAIRLDEFRRAFGDRGLFRTVCQTDYSGVLSDAGKLLVQALSPCLEGPLDTTDRDAATPGLQPDCTVSEIRDVGSDDPTEALIPRCRMLAENQPDRGSAPACWWVTSDPVCATETHLSLHVERAGPPPAGSAVRVSCAAAEAAATD